MTTVDLTLAPPRAGIAAAPNTPSASGLRDEDRRPTFAALAGAATLGVVGDLLLRAGTPGVNVLICTALGLALIAWLARLRARPLTVGAVALGALALAFAAAIAWRDAPTLLLLNLVALGAAACALVAAVRHGPALPIESADLGAYVRGAAATAASVVVGAPALARAAATSVSAPGRQITAALGVGARGAALALPALVVFGALLAAADGAFAAIAERLVGWDIRATMSHMVVATAVAWGAAGYLRAALFPAVVPRPARVGTERFRLAAFRRAPGAAEWCVALVLVDVMFVVFGVVQLGWLFGGRALVASGGVTYAEYARRGFFELVAVTALALPTALGAYGAGVRRLTGSDPRAARLRRALRLASGTLLGCLAVVLVSAFDRMRLYQDAYGMTELRFYATAFMAWLAAVGVCAATTVLRDRPAPFALGTLATAWMWVLALDAVDPAARIIATNVAHATVARPLDLSYAASLDADGVPALLTVLRSASASMPRGAAVCLASRRLDALQREADASDWRTWNLARWRAARAIARAEQGGWMRAWRAECARP